MYFGRPSASMHQTTRCRHFDLSVPRYSSIARLVRIAWRTRSTPDGTSREPRLGRAAVAATGRAKGARTRALGAEGGAAAGDGGGGVVGAIGIRGGEWVEVDGFVEAVGEGGGEQAVEEGGVLGED